jgi:hypothetical protein
VVIAFPAFNPSNQKETTMKFILAIGSFQVDWKVVEEVAKTLPIKESYTLEEITEFLKNSPKEITWEITKAE